MIRRNLKKGSVIPVVGRINIYLLLNVLETGKNNMLHPKIISLILSFFKYEIFLNILNKNIKNINNIKKIIIAPNSSEITETI